DGQKTLNPELWRQAGETFREEGPLPIREVNGVVEVAVGGTDDVVTLDELRRQTGWRVRPLLASREKMRALRRRLMEQSFREHRGDGNMETVSVEEADETTLEDLANQAPVIKLVNLIIMQGISEGASDIHVEPFEKQTLVRYRIDGVLRTAMTQPAKIHAAVLSRIKIMANLDIAERRIPQDGRISLKLMEKVYDLRVATVPCLYGEGVVMRILDKGNITLALDQLGFPDDLYAAFVQQIQRPHGIVLVTGPTGSGKTTTLYSALNHIKSDANKIITVEDPVEYNLEGINQIHVNAKVGLTFAAGLRSILRLDPDVVMVGEIRDGETAEIAIKAALTGHLVFSTLHTNDSISAVTRLGDMGVEPYLIAAAVNGILAQRLVRRTCEFCREEDTVDEQTRVLFESRGQKAPARLPVAKGCDECNGTGYSGRLAIYELFEIDEELRGVISGGASTETLRTCAAERGMSYLVDDGLRKVRAGLTTAAEVLRVAES
ncbi:MAG: type II/IV secretion system protein, partial [Lentisphaerae bacterium]